MEMIDLYNFDIELKLCPPNLLVDIASNGLNETNKIELNNYLNYLERQCKGITEFVNTCDENEHVDVIANTIGNKIDDMLNELELIESLITKYQDKDVLNKIDVIRAIIISIIGE